MTGTAPKTNTTFAALGFPTPNDEADRLAEQIIAPVLHLVEEMDGLLAWRDSVATAIRNCQKPSLTRDE